MDTQLNDQSWAEQEFAYAALGDQRRTDRLVQLATLLAQQPDASISQALPGNATRKADYRFFSNAALNEQVILASTLTPSYCWAARPLPNPSRWEGKPSTAPC